MITWVTGFPTQRYWEMVKDSGSSQTSPSPNIWKWWEKCTPREFGSCSQRWCSAPHRLLCVWFQIYIWILWHVYCGSKGKNKRSSMGIYAWSVPWRFIKNSGLSDSDSWWWHTSQCDFAFDTMHKYGYGRDILTLNSDNDTEILENSNPNPGPAGAKRLQDTKVAVAQVSNLGECYSASPLSLRQVHNQISHCTISSGLQPFLEQEEDSSTVCPGACSGESPKQTVVFHYSIAEICAV